jgi:hypothetical protein
LYSGKCINEKEECTVLAGKEQGIFAVSEKVACVDELGWDFVDLVKKGRMSFTAFCALKTKDYETQHSDSLPFMSMNTWVKWWFGWAASFRIDFRKEIDPFCKHDPPMLVVDGTHYGTANRYSKLTSDIAITKAEKQETKRAKHKR